MKRIPISELQEGMICGETIYGDHGTLLINKGAAITKSYILGLKKFRIGSLAIQDGKEETPFPPKSLSQQFIDSFEAVLQDISEYKTIRLNKTTAKIRTLLSAILLKPVVQHFLDDEIQDDMLCKHSLRTAIIAANMGIIRRYNPQTIETIALSALLHDCGMGAHFQEDDLEHPALGFRKIHKLKAIDIQVALVCLQHHERYDGKGFPFGFGKLQIIEIARLIAVADTYDRLILKNHTPRQAVFKLIAGRETILDPAMLNLFEASMH
jgi:HD-GYP domain-containing protein (c-di-GMP phosphodiesterase class II)